MGAYGHWPRATGTRSSSTQSALSPHELPLPDEGRNVRRHGSEMRVIVAAGGERLAVPRVPPPRYRISNRATPDAPTVRMCAVPRRMAFRAAWDFAPFGTTRRSAFGAVWNSALSRCAVCHKPLP